MKRAAGTRRPCYGFNGNVRGGAMAYTVATKIAAPQLIASVRVPLVPMGQVGQAWKPALDQVWAALRADGTLQPGHNFFLYHHPGRRGAPMDVDFGVTVSRGFEPRGNVRCIETPTGEIAWTLHVGPYAGMPAAHEAIHAWCAANGRRTGSASWEIYGDWNEDPAKLETTICYLLA
jgi:effector-binding domain-containing protein